MNRRGFQALASLSLRTDSYPGRGLEGAGAGSSDPVSENGSDRAVPYDGSEC
jgi:hypothetical protein